MSTCVAPNVYLEVVESELSLAHWTSMQDLHWLIVGLQNYLGIQVPLQF